MKQLRLIFLTFLILFLSPAYAFGCEGKSFSNWGVENFEGSCWAYTYQTMDLGEGIVELILFRVSPLLGSRVQALESLEQHREFYTTNPKPIIKIQGTNFVLDQYFFSTGFSPAFRLENWVIIQYSFAPGSKSMEGVFYSDKWGPWVVESLEGLKYGELHFDQSLFGRRVLRFPMAGFKEAMEYLVSQ